MPALHYHLVDVFTDVPFGGNQLAVFTDGRGISDVTMQSIARELNIAETTFVLPADNSANDYRVRIFTPGRELPMAGHPTVGTTFVLGRQKMIDVSEANGRAVLEEGVGPITVTYTVQDGAPGLVTMQQPMPNFGKVFDDRAKIADLLTLSLDDLGDTSAQVVSCGVPFLFVPIRTLDAIARVRVRTDVWEQFSREGAGNGVFVFTMETVHPENAVHSRMFAPEMGITEDPATGAASGPLGAYLVQYGLVSGNPAKITGEQGFEMKRPSIIHIEIKRDGDTFTGVSIAGRCVYMGEGTLYLEK